MQINYCRLVITMTNLIQFAKALCSPLLAGQHPPTLQAYEPYILVVDDDLTIRSLLKEALSIEGYRIRTVGNGNDALKTLQQFPKCNLLLLDLVMPGLNGEQTLEQLRSYSPNLPAVIMTGHDKEGCLPALKKLGINGFIEKPFLISEILQITCQFSTNPPPIAQQG